MARESCRWKPAGKNSIIGRADGGASFGNGDNGGADSLTVTDQNNTASDTYSISTGAIKRTGSAKISYAGVPTLMLNGGSGTDTFQIKSFDPNVPFAITGGGGVNTLDYAAFKKGFKTQHLGGT